MTFSPSSGQARRLAGYPRRSERPRVAFPNGMVVTPDNSTLIVAESYGNKLTAFDIAADGSLSNRLLWADVQSGARDGICLDAENAVTGTSPTSSACAFARVVRCCRRSISTAVLRLHARGADKRTLFLTANEWRGPATMADGPRMGQVLTAEAPAPGSVGLKAPTPSRSGDAPMTSRTITPTGISMMRLDASSTLQGKHARRTFPPSRGVSPREGPSSGPLACGLVGLVLLAPQLAARAAAEGRR